MYDIRNTENILKYKNNEIKDINKNITNTINNFKNEKNKIINIYTNELKNLKEFLYDDLKFFKYFLENEHNIYVKYLKHKLKNKEIELPTFLYLISVNKYYQKNRIKYKQENIKQQIKRKKEELNNKIKELNNKLNWELYYLRNEKSYIKFDKVWNEKKLKKLFDKLNNLNTTKKNYLQYFNTKISILYKFLKEKQQQYNKLVLQKKLQQQKIQQQKQQYSNIIIEYKEIKNYLYNNKIIKIIEKYNITEEELKQQYKEFLKDKKVFSKIVFTNYLESYGKRKLRKLQQNININNNNYIILN